MSTNDNRNLDDQEIDLAMLSEKIKGLFGRINKALFLAIRFVINHIVILGLLFIIGIGAGMYLDKSKKIYDHKIILQPNFNSTDYLYSKVELLTAKINQGDTLFLKKIGIENPSTLLKINIEPVIDIYKFISGGDKDQNEQNFELLRLLAEDGDMKKIVKEKETSKNYGFHMISFTTDKLTNRKDIVEPLLKYLNNSTYFNQIKNVYIQNAQTKIVRDNEIIAQIDGFLSNYTKSDNTPKSDKLVYYNENTQLNDVIQTKNNLISEIGALQLDLVNISTIIRESSTTLNIKNTQSFRSKLKLILPVLFIFLYIFVNLFINFYKTQAAKFK